MAYSTSPPKLFKLRSSSTRAVSIKTVLGAAPYTNPLQAIYKCCRDDSNEWHSNGANPCSKLFLHNVNEHKPGKINASGNWQMLLSDARNSFKCTIELKKQGNVVSWLLDTFNKVIFENLARQSGSLGMILFETSREDINGHRLLKFGTAVNAIEERFALWNGFCASIWSRMRLFADIAPLTTEPIVWMCDYRTSAAQPMKIIIWERRGLWQQYPTCSISTVESESHVLRSMQFLSLPALCNQGCPPAQHGGRGICD